MTLAATTTEDARSGGAERLTPLEMGAWAEFLHTHAMLVRELDDELRRAHGLPLSSYDVLTQLDGADERRMRMSELADAVLLSRSGLTRLVERLERDGLLQRTDCPGDARGAYAVLTDAGLERVRAARVTHLAGVRERFLSQLEDSELEALARYWERIQAVSAVAPPGH